MHESTSPSSNQESDEITLKDIILKIQQWWTILWPQRTKIILTALAIGLMAAMYTKFISKPTYTASYQLFFEEDGGSMSSAMRLASSFGLSMGGSGATSSITVQEYLTSRDNISKAMTMVSGQGVMAERYYEYALYEDQEFNEMFYANFGKNQRYTDSILSEITLELNEGFIAASLDEESGTVNFAINGYDEAFVYDLSKALIANTEDAFLDWKKKKGQSAVEAFQGKVDSLEIALDATLRRLGEYQDQNNSLISAVDKMEQMRLSIDMEALKVAYGEYIKGLEMSKADLMNLEPPFKYFDEPTYPLYKQKGSAAKAGIFGSVITSFLLLLFFIGRVEAKSIMAD
jgi:hypothetical protein